MSMADIVARTNDRVNTQIRKATIEVFGSVIKMTPVDTGRARGNWQCSVGSPETSQSPRFDQSGSSALAEVVSTVPRKAGSIVWLTNNLDYIQRLEYGYSRQAPSGMVRVSLSRFGAALRSA